ncbi:hypothetical protein BGZ46_002377 [Entomortierella lignicola]|nr:hypothetical protein BGZ46_002377 [Entomortierella lignicola]
MVPLKTAFVALSAPLPPQILSSVIKGIRFQSDVHIINVGNEHPNVKAKDFLRRQLKDPTDSKRIATYHAVNTDKYRQKTMEAFKNGEITTLLATEAVGMGCDINNIVRVVQYGAPPSLSSLFQRFGSAAHDPNSEVQGILLVPKKVGKKKKAEDDNGKDEDLIKYMTMTSCRREHLNQVFGNKHKVCEKCCDVCHPESIPDADTVFFQDCMMSRQLSRRSEYKHQLLQKQKCSMSDFK